MKRTNRAIIVIALLSGPTSASAQLPVVDSANLTQALQQIAAWKRQYDQMLQQHEQLRAQQAAMTGSRGLGTLANNPLLRQVVPDDLMQVYGAIQSGGSSGLTTSAQSIRRATRLYDCEGRTGRDWSTCQAFLNNAAQTQAFQQNALLLLNQRINQIQMLQGQINATNDPKGIAELQARLQVETTQVANDANRLAVLRAMSDSADRAAQQAIKEREMKNLSLTSDGTDTFVYRPYTPR